MQPAWRGSHGLLETNGAAPVRPAGEILARSQPDQKPKPPKESNHSPLPDAELLPPESVPGGDWAERCRRRESRRTFFILAGLGTVLAGLIWWWNPTERHVPVCSFYRLTGLYCPGCGGLRGTYALLHGRLAEAWAYNPLLVLLALWAGYGLVLWAMTTFWPHRRLPGRGLYDPWAFVLVALMAVLFGILRNLPWEPFCHWTPGL